MDVFEKVDVSKRSKDFKVQSRRVPVKHTHTKIVTRKSSKLLVEGVYLNRQSIYITYIFFVIILFEHYTTDE